MIVLTAITPPDDILHTEPNAAAYEHGIGLGVGTLYISKSVLVWISTNGQGFALQYPTISMHAISRNTSGFPHPCIYMVVETPKERGSDGGEHNGSTQEESDEDDDDEQSTEIRFVPSNITSLDTMYHALSECQALHPDENDSFSDEEEDEEEAGDDAANEVPVAESDEQIILRMRGIRQDEDEEEPQLPVASRHYGYDAHGHSLVADIRARIRGAAAMEDDGPEEDEAMETGQFEDA